MAAIDASGGSAPRLRRVVGHIHPDAVTTHLPTIRASTPVRPILPRGFLMPAEITALTDAT
jgi:hypothetical protein